jgi:hypothetical protein
MHRNGWPSDRQRPRELTDRGGAASESAEDLTPGAVS